MKILGIETSADDTGVALIEATGEFGVDVKFQVLANAINSQSAMHAEYGGIFPAKAKSEHAKHLPLLLEKVLADTKTQLSDIDAIAVTVGPGLEPCLWTAITFVQELAGKSNCPVVPVNHMEGHILISMMKYSNTSRKSEVLEFDMEEFEYPALALLISGGHTELILMKEFGSCEYIGRTRDDAVGEAFDKVARMLGLPYPGGPHISRLAEESRQTHEATPRGFKLPRPMMNADSYEFSFAGLKTAVLRYVEANKPLSDDTKKIIAREFEDAATEVLVSKTVRAADEYDARAVIIGGGVSANKHIRSELNRELSTVDCKLLACPPEFSTDNAVMIALSGYFHALKKEFADPASLVANGSMKLAPLE